MTSNAIQQQLFDTMTFVMKLRVATCLTYIHTVTGKKARLPLITHPQCPRVYEGRPSAYSKAPKGVPSRLLQFIAPQIRLFLFSPDKESLQQIAFRHLFFMFASCRAQSEHDTNLVIREKTIYTYLCESKYQEL